MINLSPTISKIIINISEPPLANKSSQICDVGDQQCATEKIQKQNKEYI